MSFFEDFDDARYEFTIGDENDPSLVVLQAGIVATFFLEKAALRLPKVAQALQLYLERYGDKLRCGYVGDNPKQRLKPSLIKEAAGRVAHGNPQGGNEFFLSSAQSIDYVGDYTIQALIDAEWFERVHGTLSYLCFYLPVEELTEEHGRREVEQVFGQFCELLSPLHGEMGLGFQHCRPFEDYQHFEYEQALEFNGLTAGHALVGAKVFRTGLKTVNWYTALDNKWVSQLGGEEVIKRQLDDDRIQLIPYASGLIVKAGEWPALGWVKKDPFPELYVKVNRVLKPVRAPEVKSFHYGSIAGEARFGPRSSNEWMQRFDRAPEPPARSQRPELTLAAAAPVAPSRHESGRCPAGQPCPRSGFWFTPARVGSRQHFEQGQVMPEVGGDYGATIWQWDEQQAS